jgi:maleate isomerase
VSEEDSRTIVKRLGILIPSSNTVVEAEAPLLVPRNGNVTLHFSRFRVNVIDDSAASEAQFELQAMVDAATLLGDAEVDRIVWAGTAASWLGFNRDRMLVEAVSAATGRPAMTAVTAINSLLKELGTKTIALVTPYTAALERKIILNYDSIGIATLASERLDLTTNTEFAAVSQDRIADMCRMVTKSAPDAIVIMCTNLRAATIAEELTREIGTPVVDSVAATLRRCLRDLE